MITSKLMSKAQTTIPQPVRLALDLREGDKLEYKVEGRRVILTKVQVPPGVDDPLHTFDEWYSDADAKAYADL
jgi:antitoxin PrlF